MLASKFWKNLNEQTQNKYMKSDFRLTNHPKTRLLIDVYFKKIIYVYMYLSGFGGLGVACWPLVPKFAGSNPAEAVGFLREK